MRHVPVWFFLSLAAAAGCADPNPTFVFDAAPVTREAGTDGPSDAGVADGAANDDGSTDAAGDAR
jgi:hypothetical protein